MFICEFCDREFTIEDSVKRHQKFSETCLKIQKRIDVQNNKCEFCNKKFTRKDNLKRHQRISETCLKIQKVKGIDVQTNKYKCEFCNKEFTTKGNLKRHIDNSCKQKSYVIQRTADSKINNVIINNNITVDKKKKKTVEQFIKEVQVIHKDEKCEPLYDYSLFVYVNNHTKGKIKCKKCNEIFEQVPSNHLRGNGCPYCCKGKSQNLVKQIFKLLLKVDFKQCRPPFLKNLEYDGYNEQLKLAFEYQGRQHYEYIPYFHKNGIEDFEAQKERDLLKRTLSEKNNIKLIEIPYTYNYQNQNKMKEFIENELSKHGFIKRSIIPKEISFNESLTTIKERRFNTSCAPVSEENFNDFLIVITDENVDYYSKPEMSIYCNINIEFVEKAFKEHYTKELHYQGIEGVAQFIRHHIINIDNSNLYSCSDSSNNILKFITPSGKIVKDVDANNLINVLKKARLYRLICEFRVKLAKEYYAEKEYYDQGILKFSDSEETRNKYMNKLIEAESFASTNKAKFVSTISMLLPGSLSIYIEEQEDDKTYQIFSKEDMITVKDYLEYDSKITSMFKFKKEPIIEFPDND